MAPGPGRLRALHLAAVALAAPVEAEPEAVARLLSRIVALAVASMEGIAGRLLVPDEPPWVALLAAHVPAAGGLDGPDADGANQAGAPVLSVRHSGVIAREHIRPGDDEMHVLNGGELVYVADTQAPSTWGAFPSAVRRGVGSFALAPLRVGDRTVGALAVDFALPRALDAEGRELLALFAAHAAAALERVRVLDAARRRAEEAEHLAQQLAAERARLEAMEAVQGQRGGQLRAVLDAAGDAMLMVAPDRRFLFANRRVTDLFGLAHDQVVGRTFADLAPEVGRVFADAGGFSAQVAGTASDPELVFRTTVLQRWPHPRELELSSMPAHDTGGAFLGRLYVFRDVTHERAVDRMKSKFVAMVSHELRTPLTSIKGYIDLLLEGEVGEVDPQQREFLEVVRSNADRLVSLVNEILDLSRMESGRIELKRAPLDLAQLLHGAAESLRPQLQGKRLRLTLEIPTHLPPVNGDADRLTHVFVNLVSNAYKYTPPEGDIVLGAQVIERGVRVVVRDTGIGMTPDELARLFTPFFRSQNPAARDAGGTGLGLSIAKSIVDLHGGEIAVDSAPGTGTTMAVTLPV